MVPVPMPGDGSTITQLGHVDDLADAMCGPYCGCRRKPHLQLFVSQRDHLAGVVKAAALACGKDPEAVDVRHFDPSGWIRKPVRPPLAVESLPD